MELDSNLIELILEDPKKAKQKMGEYDAEHKRNIFKSSPSGPVVDPILHRMQTREVDRTKIQITTVSNYSSSSSSSSDSLDSFASSEKYIAADSPPQDKTISSLAKAQKL